MGTRAFVTGAVGTGTGKTVRIRDVGTVLVGKRAMRTGSMEWGWWEPEP
jgi:hypothetical protein